MNDAGAQALDSSTARRRRYPPARLFGTFVALVVVAYLLSRQPLGRVLQSIRASNPEVLVLSFLLILVDMLLRAVRWRALLGERSRVAYWPVFSALMVGYLANFLLPARAGDLVRVYTLGNGVDLSRSRILGTVFIERVLDMAAVVAVLALIASISPLPDWLRHGAMALAGGTVAGVLVLLFLATTGPPVTARLVAWVARCNATLGERAQLWVAEFSRAAHRFRLHPVMFTFAITTAAVWMLEILVVVSVASSLGMPLSPLDGAVLMLFSLFSSLIPALPGQVGTFELAMIAGLAFLGRGGAAALPFALTLHLVLLAGTGLIGLACLVGSGLPLLPRKLMQRLEQQR